MKTKTIILQEPSPDFELLLLNPDTMEFLAFRYTDGECALPYHSVINKKECVKELDIFIRTITMDWMTAKEICMFWTEMLNGGIVMRTTFFAGVSEEFITEISGQVITTSDNDTFTIVSIGVNEFLNNVSNPETYQGIFEKMGAGIAEVSINAQAETKSLLSRLIRRR